MSQTSLFLLHCLKLPQVTPLNHSALCLLFLVLSSLIMHYFSRITPTNGLIIIIYIFDADCCFSALFLLSDEHPSVSLILLLLLFLIVRNQFTLTAKTIPHYFLFVLSENGVFIAIQVLEVPNVLRRLTLTWHQHYHSCAILIFSNSDGFCLVVCGHYSVVAILNVLILNKRFKLYLHF